MNYCRLSNCCGVLFFALGVIEVATMSLYNVRRVDIADHARPYGLGVLTFFENDGRLLYVESGHKDYERVKRMLTNLDESNDRQLQDVERSIQRCRNDDLNAFDFRFSHFFYCVPFRDDLIVKIRENYRDLWVTFSNRAGYDALKAAMEDANVNCHGQW